MADQSTYPNFDDAQLHYLKAQYLAALQMVDQTETALRAQLDQVGKTRKQLQELMGELDVQLAGATTPEAPSKPAGKPARKPTPRRTRRRPVTN